MRLPTTADVYAHPTGDGNDIVALHCRATTGGTSWSAHAYGVAIDVDPFNNPYEKGDVAAGSRIVVPRPLLAAARHDPAHSLVVREFARIGWSWGGDWSSLKDYQHFSATGR